MKWDRFIETRNWTRNGHHQASNLNKINRTRKLKFVWNQSLIVCISKYYYLFLFSIYRRPTEFWGTFLNIFWLVDNQIIHTALLLSSIGKFKPKLTVLAFQIQKSKCTFQIFIFTKKFDPATGRISNFSEDRIWDLKLRNTLNVVFVVCVYQYWSSFLKFFLHFPDVVDVPSEIKKRSFQYHFRLYMISWHKFDLIRLWSDFFCKKVPFISNFWK